MRRRWTVAAVYVVALAMTMTACSQRTNVTTTNDSAHSNIIRLLNENLDGLPPRTTLSSTVPGRSGVERFPVSSPCDDSDSDPEQPYRWGLTLWALLPSSDAPEAAATRLVNHWQQRGYTISGSGDDRTAETTDGYTLSHATTVQGDLSVSVESPCFPKSQLNQSMEWPTTLSK